MFTVIKTHVEHARSLIEAAKTIKHFNKDLMLEYLRRAQLQLIMAELYVK